MPQNTVVGPLLFSVHVVQCMQYFKTTLFADYTMIPIISHQVQKTTDITASKLSFHNHGKNVKTLCLSESANVLCKFLVTYRLLHCNLCMNNSDTVIASR